MGNKDALAMQDSAPQSRLYLDDLQPGQQFHSGTEALDADQIIAFASEYDPQAFHLDADAAADSFFQGLAASGWHTAAITMRLIVQSMPFAQGIIGAGGEIAWPRPTRPGDILRVESTVLSVTPSRSRPDRGMVLMHCQTLNQADDVLQDFKVRLLMFKNPDAA